MTLSGSFGAVSSCLRASEREKCRSEPTDEAADVVARDEMDERRATAAVGGRTADERAARRVG